MVHDGNGIVFLFLVFFFWRENCINSALQIAKYYVPRSISIRKNQTNEEEIKTNK